MRYQNAADMEPWQIQSRQMRHPKVGVSAEQRPKPLPSRMSPTHRVVGVWRWLYGCGRVLQGLGLLLIWWVLLLFAGTADMGTLLMWSLAAVTVFYVGWVCTTWAKKAC
jgi:hypothetical protein